jgi:hypothetical protein
MKKRMRTETMTMRIESTIEMVSSAKWPMLVNAQDRHPSSQPRVLCQGKQHLDLDHLRHPGQIRTLIARRARRL